MKIDAKTDVAVVIKAACDFVGCKVKDLLKSRLTEVAVVLIVGPGGGKHIIPFADLDTPPPVTTEVEAEEAPVSAVARRESTPVSAAPARVRRRSKKAN